MEIFALIEIWFEHPFVWKCLVYILLAVLLVLPFIIGVVVILLTLYFSLTLPMVSSTENDTVTNRNLVSSPQIRPAFIGYLVRKEKKDFYLHSVPNYYNLGDIFVRDLKTMVYTYIMPYTTTALEYIPVLPTSRHYLRSSLKASDNRHLHMLKANSCDSNSYKKTSASPYCVNGPSEEEDNFSAPRLTYLDLSLKRYWQSSQNFYKEKRPIHFKFWSNT